MKSKQHILVLTPGFPKSESDSTCIPALQALVHELNTRYNDQLLLHVVALQYPFDKGFYSWNGIKCWSAGGKNKSFPGKLVTWFNALRVVWKIHKQEKIDVVHSFWLHDSTLLGQWIAKFTGAVHITHAMGQDVLPGNSYPRYMNRDKIKVIANSPFSSRTLASSFHWQSHKIIPFGIRPEDFRAIPSAERHTDLLAVGSLTEIKNHKEFIELFKMLKQKFPLLKGKIIGEGPLLSELAKQVKILGLEHNLELTGRLNRDEVLKCMSESKILLHTAPFESAAYVFLEALYSGVKVVSYDTGFLPEVEDAYRCSGKTEMLEVLQKLLAENQIYNRTSVPTIQETAIALLKVYQEQ